VAYARRKRGFQLVLVFLGLFGLAFAISGVFVSLPKPSVGVSCGPGSSSEPAIVALFDPGSIGAGPEPPVTNTADRANWLAFVGQCQASADGRVLANFLILTISLGVALAGTALVLKARQAPESVAPTAPVAGSPPYPSALLPQSPGAHEITVTAELGR
jgi:hypothetical protein